jgi:phosphopantothenate synthetase
LATIASAHAHGRGGGHDHVVGEQAREPQRTPRLAAAAADATIGARREHRAIAADGERVEPDGPIRRRCAAIEVQAGLAV